MTERVTEHHLPVWADRADTVVTVLVPDVDDAVERLVLRWAGATSTRSAAGP